MTQRWHQWLNMTHHDTAWHEHDIANELAEYKAETKLLRQWSEACDVVYAWTRSRWDGYDLPFPLVRWQYYVGSVYMFPKYTGRWLFFRVAGQKAGAVQPIHAVRNPRKTAKLHNIAEKAQVDAMRFQQICERQLKYWPLLP